MNGSFAILRVSTRILFITLLLVAVTICMAQPSYYQDRWKKPQTITALQNPYTWGDTIYCSGTDYTVPDSIIICEVRVTDSCLMKVDLRNKTGVSIRCSANDIFRLDVRKFYSTGTDAGVRSGNKIRVFGIINPR